MSVPQENHPHHEDLLIQGEALYDVHTALYHNQGQHEYEFPGTGTLHNPVINGEKTTLHIQNGTEEDSPVFHFQSEIIISPHEEMAPSAGLWSQQEFLEIQHLLPPGEWSITSAVPSSSSNADHALVLVNPRGLEVTVTIPSGEGYSDYASRAAVELLADEQFSATGTFSQQGQDLLKRLAGGQRGNSAIELRTNCQYWRYAQDPDTSWRDLFAWHYADYTQLRTLLMQKLTEGRQVAVSKTTALDPESIYSGPSELELEFNKRRLDDLRAVQTGNQMVEDRTTVLQLAPIPFGNNPYFKDMQVSISVDQKTGSFTIHGALLLAMNRETNMSGMDIHNLVQAIRSKNLELPGYIDGQHITQDQLTASMYVSPAVTGRPGVFFTFPTASDRAYASGIAHAINRLTEARTWTHQKTYRFWKEKDEVRALLSQLIKKRNKRISFMSHPIPDDTDPQLWTNIDYTLHHIQTVVNQIADLKNAPIKKRKVELDI